MLYCLCLASLVASFSRHLSPGPPCLALISSSSTVGDEAHRAWTCLAWPSSGDDLSASSVQQVNGVGVKVLVDGHGQLLAVQDLLLQGRQLWAYRTPTARSIRIRLPRDTAAVPRCSLWPFPVHNGCIQRPAG